MKIILFILVYNLTFSQGFIDTVYSFKPGTIQFSGQSEDYYPENIFGPPAFNATKQSPEIRPDEILSIGLNGEIVVGFKNGYIKNGEGIDFIIFENAFEISFNNKIYAEPAIVSVSEDGENWFTFDYDLDALTGLAGTNYTIGDNSNSEYGFSGGNAFDLDDIGIDKIKYLKLKDTTEYILDNTDHNNYDPTLSGFDLDAVFLLYPEKVAASVEKMENKSKIIAIYDLNGNKVANISKKGMYFIVYESGVKKILKY